MPSGFKKRLTRLHASRQRLRQPERGEKDGESRVFFAHDAPQERAPVEDPDPWLQVGAQVQVSARGEAYYLHQAHLGALSHGGWRLEQGRDVEMGRFCDRFPALFAREQTRKLPEIAPEQLAFIDLETNGLSKQSYPFCVGIGLWEDEHFSVYHFLMRSPADEPAVLSASVELLKKTQGICTFNGDSFDIPMLKRRCEFHQIAHPFDTLPQLDLLKLSRKIYTHRKRHALGRLEEDLLEFQRVDDVPSAQIPALWNNYLKAKDPRPLLKIFEHNRLDILSMVALLAEFSQSFSSSAPCETDAPSAPIAPAKSSVSRMNQSLARAYALREKSQPPRSSHPRPKPTPGAPAFSRGELSRGMPIGGRLRILRAEVEDLLARPDNADASAQLLARLHEMLALAPRHPFALEKIVEHYRQTHQPALWRHFEKRLQEISPF